MKKSLPFWSYQVKTTWQNLAALSPVARISSVLKLSAEMVGRHESATRTPMVGVGIPEDEQLTVIVLNHKRPQNVGQIAKYVLRSGFVNRLVISNNSQAYPIEDYIEVEDSRLVLLNQETPAGVGISMELARDYPSKYYLRVDDDIFLHPAQLSWLYWNLRHFPESTHGIFGAAYSADESSNKGWPFVHKRNFTGAIDILNGLFCFTRQHLDEYFRLCELIGIHDQKTLMNGEDIVLSFSGSRKPLIHNIGPIWECASESSPGVALHQTRPGFYEERWRIFSELEKIKSLDGSGQRPGEA